MPNKPPNFIVRKNGIDKGKIYKFYKYSMSRGFALFERGVRERITLNIDELNNVTEGDYEVYEPKIGDNILPFKEGDDKRLIREFGDVKKGFIINSIVNDIIGIGFILSDKGSGRQIEARGSYDRRNLDEAYKKLALAKCINSELLKELPNDLIHKIAENIKIPEEFDPMSLTVKMDLGGGGDKRNYKNKINTKKKKYKRRKSKKKSKRRKKYKKRSKRC